MSRILLLCLSLCFASVTSAQTLRLSQEAPIICRVEFPAKEWLPSPHEIAALERALPIYLASQARTSERMPTLDVEFDRQYSGIVRRGKKYISGSYFPASKERPFFAKAGDCWLTMDGGSRHWGVVFDQKSGKIIRHTVNGIA
jgi:hypothetical protein